jgi:hypothetical protein
MTPSTVSFQFDVEKQSHSVLPLEALKPLTRSIPLVVFTVVLHLTLADAA